MGIAVSPDGRYLLTLAQQGERYQVWTRGSTSSSFANPTIVSELLPNPMYPALGLATISRDGTLYYTRRNAMNNSELWTARR
jgi:hypothetical protein